MKNFISTKDVDNVDALVQSGLKLKSAPFDNASLGKNKTLGLIFFNPSLRTRLSSQKAGLNLGMNVIVMNINGDGWNIEFEDGTVMDGNTQEHIKDAVAVISSYCDILGVRTFPSLTNRHADYNEEVMSNFLKYSSVPVVSLESATLHPLQSLADLITIAEYKIAKPKVAVTWAPHPRALPQAVTNSFLQWVQHIDAEVVLAHPPGYELSPEFVGNATVTNVQNEALENADFVYTKNWSSFSDYGKILTKDPSWIVSQEKMDLTNNGKFMHCMPVRRNVIATDEVLDNSIILQQASNRTFSAQAVFKSILEEL